MTSRKKTLVGFAVVAVVLSVVPNVTNALDAPGFYLTFLFTMFFWISQASSWNILTGFSGYFSFGQGAWFGIGVYATGILPAKNGWPFLVALPVAGLAALGAGLLLGVVVFRLRQLSGEIFALTTLAVSFVLASIAAHVGWLRSALTWKSRSSNASPPTLPGRPRPSCWPRCRASARSPPPA